LTLATQQLAVAGLLLNALVWGISWLPFRWLQTRGLQSLWTTTGIYLIASALVALLVVSTRRRSAAGSARGSVMAMMWLAFAAGLSSACFNWAVTIGSVVRVILLFYLMPIWAILLARWLLNEPITVAALARIILALAGAAIVLWHPQIGLPMPQSLADWLAIVGGAAFALTNVMLRRLGKVDPMACAQSMFVGSWLIAGSLATVLAAQGLVSWPASDVLRWLPGTVAIAVVFLVANLGLQYGAARLPANVTAVVMISEVLFAAASSLLLGDEVLSIRLCVGGLLVVAAAWLSAREPAHE
jgi:drug/metabolite transporter (DMT)-like permease